VLESIAFCQRPRRVAEAGLKRSQHLDRLVGPGRVRRGFECVDVEVIGERMARCHGEHAIEFGDQPLGAGLRLAILRPQIPGPEFRE
jgi:hypothetical protein